MPELPEVETVRRTLGQLVVGKTIESIEVGWGRIIKKPDDINEFTTMLVGQTFRAIGRRGKFLIFHLDDVVLVSHLRMEGRYGVYKKTDERSTHTHIIFEFTDGTELRYQDVRKFGTMHVFAKGTEELELPLSKLGLEPFSEDFTVEQLKSGMKKTNRKIKVALLDQNTVVGLGNIYVDEALFRAGIHPERSANSLQEGEYVKLHKHIINTLQQAVDLGGSSIKSYVNGQGEMGMFQQNLDVYGRKEEPCRKCGTLITKTVVGGRGTHFCLKCQK
ncbi:DNA-formamidopyrimidine glycosylase [Bacillus solitudinis]|uniref:DNA-formamidopyrimidine glycosylase n=1 Tax=Bacillus solitudinis TaxID=2014074 RepID=UPI000C23A850|nr:DNA-formamidopyrimidine glycosylase [Bacillus solitudinis]